MESGQWTDIKPDGKEPCVFVTASFYAKNWEYTAWELKYINTGEGEYLALLQDGYEWGDLEELRADLYFILPTHKP